jgi:glycosyltransferase involved in cell wall biosynthesis
MPARLCLFAEELVPPFDEGYKNFTYHLFKEAPEGRDVLRIGQGDPGVLDCHMHSNRLLLTPGLRRSIKRFHPEAIVYVPTASATSASFVRARILKWHGGNVPVAIIGLQPRPYSTLARVVVRAFRPDAVYVQSESARSALVGLGIRARLVRAGVDSEKFRPVTTERRLSLREKHGLPQSASIVLHVGHINSRRNLEAMAEIQRIPGMQTVVVASSSTIQDEQLANSLAEAGVTLLLRGYIPNIEELYQLADAYVFPVLESTAAIHFPLSVLEAMACNLPVVATPFGGLADCFDEKDGLYFVRSAGEFAAKLPIAVTAGARTRQMVEPFNWPTVVGDLLSEIDKLVCEGAAGR